MSLNVTGGNAVHQAGLHPAAGAPASQPAQAQIGSGNVNGQAFTAHNAAGPASTGPGPVVAGLKSFGKLLATPALTVAGKIEAHRTAKADAAAASARAARAAVASAHTDRMVLRTALSSVGQSSILNETLSVPGPNGTSVPVTIENLMADYHAALQNVQVPGGHGAHDFTKATPGEVKAWVAMGEKICKQIYSGNGHLPLTIAVPDPNGQPRNVAVPANLDTTRAVAWYLTAQAMKDNHVPGQNPLHVASGTFIHKDPGNRLMNFLQSSDKAYGRYSSHFKHGRAIGENNTPGAQRFQGSSPALGLLLRQKLQNGIEDFSSKFPGNGGTMLFHNLQDVNGEGRIFMKFESVGVPDAYRGGFEKHGDVEAEKATKKEALNRCHQHGANFSSTLGKLLHIPSEPKHPGMTNRGEKLKHDGPVDVDAYKDLLDNWADGAQLTEGELKAGSKGDHIAGNMDRNLQKIEAHIHTRQDGATNFASTLTQINAIRQNIADLGPTFGSVRAGSEVYSDAPGGLANKNMNSLF